MLPKSGNTVATATSFPATGQIGSEISNEPCPVCQEKILEQKMVFQCGHSMCCKCEYPSYLLKICLRVILYVILLKFTSVEVYTLTGAVNASAPLLLAVYNVFACMLYYGLHFCKSNRNAFFLKIATLM